VFKNGNQYAFSTTWFAQIHLALYKKAQMEVFSYIYLLFSMEPRPCGVATGYEADN
jgi:hypothetical protein